MRCAACERTNVADDYLVGAFSKRQTMSYLFTWIRLKLVLVALVCMVTSIEHTIGNKYILEPGSKSSIALKFYIFFFVENKYSEWNLEFVQ